MNKRICENISAFHPGYYINDIIEEMEITQLEFAIRLNITPKNLSDLINGKASISNSIAKNLSLMLGTSVDVWLNLQKTYDEKVIEIQKLESQLKEVAFLDIVDYSFFVKLGMVKQTKNKQEKVTELLKYLKIASFDVLKKNDFLVQYRKGSGVCFNENRIINANAWVQTVINFGCEIVTKSFNAKLLKSFIPEICQMIKDEPKVFLPRLKEILSDCGIALVVIPSLKNSNVYGAIKWVGHDKVVLGITNRGLYADIFWFSLFHELGHVLQKRIKSVFVSSGDFICDEKITIKTDNYGCNNELEINADEFAKNNLIPRNVFDKFILKADYSRESILDLSRQINIPAGFIVGRLQKEKIIPYDRSNALRIKYE